MSEVPIDGEVVEAKETTPLAKLGRSIMDIAGVLRVASEFENRLLRTDRVPNL